MRAHNVRRCSHSYQGHPLALMTVCVPQRVLPHGVTIPSPYCPLAYELLLIHAWFPTPHQGQDDDKYPYQRYRCYHRCVRQASWCSQELGVLLLDSTPSMPFLQPPPHVLEDVRITVYIWHSRAARNEYHRYAHARSRHSLFVSPALCARLSSVESEAQQSDKHQMARG